MLNEHEVDPESWNDATRGMVSFRTLFGGPTSRTGQFTAGVADLKPGDGAEQPLRAGSAVFIPGGTTHGLRNVGRTSARLFYTLAAGSFDDVRYVFVE